MAQFKDQHFVPKSFFKLFSEDRIYIAMYHLKKKFSALVPLSTQCQKGYFYSENPDQEKSFKRVEDATLEVLRKIISSESLNELSEEDIEFLRLFVLFQRGRTQSAKLHVEQASDFFAKRHMRALMKTDPSFPKGLTEEKLNRYRIVDKNAFNKLLMLHLNAVILLRDLGLLLLINETDNDFIFSDNPVVFYNEYLRWLTGNGDVGFQIPGLQIFCPISPKLCIFFFDTQTYHFRYKSHKNALRIFKKSDIDSINTLQFFNCDSNIYFRRLNDSAYINELHSKISYRGGGLRKMVTKEKTIFNVSTGKYEKKDFAIEEMPDFPLNLHFIKNMPLFERVPQMRSPNLFKPYKETTDRLFEEMRNAKAAAHRST